MQAVQPSPASKAGSAPRMVANFDARWRELDRAALAALFIFSRQSMSAPGGARSSPNHRAFKAGVHLTRPSSQLGGRAWPRIGRGGVGDHGLAADHALAG